MIYPMNLLHLTFQHYYIKKKRLCLSSKVWTKPLELQTNCESMAIFTSENSKAARLIKSRAALREYI